MSSLYPLCVWLHIVAAATWIGSMAFFSAVVVPVLRRAEMRESAPRLIRLLGARFRVLGWIALAVLVLTGTLNLHFRGVGWTLLREATFWSTPFGRALGYKLAFVAFVLVATAAHEALNRRLAPRPPAGADDAATAKLAAKEARARRQASWLGRSAMLASLAIVYFAAALVRGFF